MTYLLSSPDLSVTPLGGPLHGRYQILGVWATKPWGRTYLAQDLHCADLVECLIHHFTPIAVVPNYFQVVKALFDHEVTLRDRLGQHPQIPQLLACFEDNQGFYVVQELIHGIPLALELQPHQPWTPEAVMQLLQAVLPPLAFVHRHGSLHGNLKPENLLRCVENGQLTLIGFSSMVQIQVALMVAYGLEVPPADAAQRGYQPLEQLQGLPCAASDVYALGMIAVQALTGRCPTEFQISPQTMEIFWQDYLPQSASPLLPALVEILNGMVQWNLVERFATADEVLLALGDRAAIATSEPSWPQPCLPVAWNMPAAPIAAPGEEPVAGALSGGGGQAVNPFLAETLAAPLGAVQAEVIQPEVLSGRMQQGAIAPTAQPAQPVTEVLVPIVPSPAAPRSAATGGFSLKQLLCSAIASPSLRLGAGGFAVATTCATVGWGLLTSLDFADKANAVWERLSRALGEGQQQRQHSAKVLAAQWWHDWQTASQQYQQAELAFEEGRLVEAQQLAAKMPNIPFWRDRWAGLEQRVIAKAETEARQLLQTAYDDAYERRFTKALEDLNQISPQSSVGEIVQTKRREYQEKQAIKAWADLQKAYDRAVAKDFTNALSYLYQIPIDTPAYPIAQQKIQEYREKEKLRAEFLLKSAAERAEQQKLVSAIATLNTIPAGTPVDQAVDARLEQYTAQLNHHAEQLLLQAKHQQQAGKVDAALATLCEIPLGTTAYAEARELLVSLEIPDGVPPLPAPSQDSAIALTPPPPYRNLNPGTYLRETSPATFSRMGLYSVK